MSAFRDGSLGAAYYGPTAARPVRDGVLGSAYRDGSLGEVTTTQVRMLIVGGVLVRGLAGYFVGKAVAPSSAKSTKYAVAGALSAAVLGTVGLGITAAVALNSKG